MGFHFIVLAKPNILSPSLSLIGKAESSDKNIIEFGMHQSGLKEPRQPYCFYCSRMTLISKPIPN